MWLNERTPFCFSFSIEFNIVFNSIDENKENFEGLILTNIVQGPILERCTFEGVCMHFKPRYSICILQKGHRSYTPYPTVHKNKWFLVNTKKV